MLCSFSQNQFVGPLLVIVHPLLVCISFNPIFNLAKHHLHKYSLWANPSAKKSAKNHGENDDNKNKDQHTQSEHDKILGGKKNRKKVKLPFEYIKLKQRVAIKMDKWKSKKKQ